MSIDPITSSDQFGKFCSDTVYQYALAHIHALNAGAMAVGARPAYNGDAPAQAGKPPRAFDTFESNDAARKSKIPQRRTGTAEAASAAASAAAVPALAAASGADAAGAPAPPTVAKPFTITSGARLMLAATGAAVANLCEKSTSPPTFAALAAQPLPEAAFLGIFVRAADAMRGHLSADPLQRDQGVPAVFTAKLNAFTSAAAHSAVETLSRCLTDFFKCIACRAAELAFDCGTAASPRAWTLNEKTLRGIFRSLAVAGAGADAGAANAAMTTFIDYVKLRAGAAEAARAAARSAARAARAAAAPLGAQLSETATDSNGE